MPTIKLYAGIYLLPTLLFKKKNLLNNPKEEIKKFFKNVTRSVIYLLIEVNLVWYGLCLMKKLLGESN